MILCPTTSFLTHLKDCRSGFKKCRKTDCSLQGKGVMQGRHSLQRLPDGRGFPSLDEREVVFKCWRRWSIPIPLNQ